MNLPIGKGRSFGADLPGAANAVVGGWTISSIVSAHTGFPDHDPSRTTTRNKARVLVVDPNLVGESLQRRRSRNQCPIDGWL